MSLDDMAKAHRDDYAAQHDLDNLRAHIEEFLKLPDRAMRLRPRERDDLASAVRALRRASDHIVAVWD